MEMRRFCMADGAGAADFLIEEEAFEGVRRIGDKVAADITLVTGQQPRTVRRPGDSSSGRVILMATAGASPLLNRLEAEGKLSLEGIRGRREVYLYQIIEEPFEENPGIRTALVVAGSDKRGTIYGMFGLSERAGVSPLVYFGDVVPEHRDEVVLSLPAPFLSREPSVRYRGFFINDEWPAFGNWCTETFGGVNEQAYEKIFELLLRLKGNYLWPAMWRSSFSEDGPGIANASLADLYGVVMGTSHHEPMCRAGVEWQNQYQNYGTDSTWCFLSNGTAITKFWEDGILRNRAFENVVTIGMRGENDSKLMPEDATLADNIEAVKKAILTQDALLRQHVSPDLKLVPRMLAIYKEVEDYYYGDDTCEGLKDWEELRDVIFLLSDDNHGNLRALPDEAQRRHPGGFGMYYHFDYHGGPISYEWVNTNRLAKIREQMAQAWEYGVREMWIVNVGDLKGMEYPLSFFLDLAYDFDTWGAAPDQAGETALRSREEEYTQEWVRRQFGSRVSADQRRRIAEVLEGYTKWNGLRTPESMNESIYHPVHFREGERVWSEAGALLQKTRELNEELQGEAGLAYRSMIYYPAAASLNLVLACVASGINRELAGRGSLYANVWADRAEQHILQDAEYVEAFHRDLHGKWNHCMSSAHTGFRGWDDNNWLYPQIRKVLPVTGGKSIVGFRGSGRYHLGLHWGDTTVLVNDDFTRPDREEVLADIDSRGRVPFRFAVEYDCPWLGCEPMSGRVETGREDSASLLRQTLHFTVRRGLLCGREEAPVKVNITFDDGETTFTRLMVVAEPEEETAEKPEQAMAEKPREEVAEKPEQAMAEKPREEVAEKPEQAMAEKPERVMEEKPEQAMAEKPERVMEEKPEQAVAEKPDRAMAEKPEQAMAEKPGDETEEQPGDEALPAEEVFLERQGYCCIRAEHFSEKKERGGARFCVMPHLGREGDALKVLPSTAVFEDASRAPYVRYAMEASREGVYCLDLYLLSRNPVVKGGRMDCFVSANGDEPVRVPAVSDSFYTESFNREWAEGVLNRVRVAKARLSLKKGRNDIYLYAGAPGILPEKLVLYPECSTLPDSYLGPEESCRREGHST